MALLEDRDQRVVPAGLDGAGRQPSPPGVEKMLLERLRADDFVVRAAAATGACRAEGDGRGASADRGVSRSPRATAPTSAGPRSSARSTPSSRRPAARAPGGADGPDWAVRFAPPRCCGEQGVHRRRRGACGRRRRRRPSTIRAWQALVAPPFSPHAFIDTDKGTIEIELAILDAPLTVDNFVTLARKGFFNGLAIHRVVPDFVVQDGDPRGDGEGGPGYTIRDEINQRPYLRGTVGHGARLEGHRRQPVLHHALAAAAPRRALYGVRSRGERDGRRRSDRAVGDVVRRCADLGRGHRDRNNPVPGFCKSRLPLLRRLLLRALLLSSPFESPPSRWSGLRAVRRAIRRTLPPGTSARMSAFSLRGTLPGRGHATCVSRERSNWSV